MTTDPGSFASAFPRPDPRTRADDTDASDRADTLGEGPADTASTATPSTSDPQREWRVAVAIGLATYAVTRLCVMAGTAIRASQRAVDDRLAGRPETPASTSVSDALTSWDGLWYLEVARNGYPESIPPDVTFDQLEARAAFFPMFPGAIRLVDGVLPGGDTVAALVLNVVLGALAVILVGLLAREVADTTVATKAMVLFAVFPGSFVLSFAYAEALMFVFAGCCLLFLRDERWVLAGLAAALTTATRPNGVAIIAACAVAAFLAIRRSRDWSSLAAPLLAPLGFLGFMLYVDTVADERGAWFRVQSEAWDEGVSFGLTAITSVGEFLTDPFASPTGGLTALSLAAVIFMGWASWRVRLPWEWLAYSAVIVAMVLLPDTVTIRPRFVLAAFPLFIGVAAWWPSRTNATTTGQVSRAVWDIVLLTCGAGLVGLTGLYASLGVIP